MYSFVVYALVRAWVFYILYIISLGCTVVYALVRAWVFILVYRTRMYGFVRLCARLGLLYSRWCCLYAFVRFCTGLALPF